MATPSRYQKVEARDKVNSRVQWKTNQVAGSTNRDYSTPAQTTLKNGLLKTSKVMRNIKQLIDDNGDILTKLKDIDGIVDISKQASNILRRIKTYVDNNKLDQAVKIYNEEFIRISKKVSVKRALSVGELEVALKSQGQLSRACERYAKIFDYAGKVKKGLKVCEKAVKYYAFLRAKVTGDDITNKSRKMSLYSDDIANSRKLREGMMAAKKDMDIVIEVCKDLTEFTIPGIQEYLTFTLDAFSAVNALVIIIDKKSTEVEDLLSEIDKLFQEYFNSMSIKAGDVSNFADWNVKGNERGLNKNLDNFFKNK